MASFPNDSNDGDKPTHGAGDRSEYYSKWDALAKEAVEEVEAEEKRQKEEADAKLGLNTDAPTSAQQAADLEKRKQLKHAKKRWDGVEADREKLKVYVSDIMSGEKTIDIVEDLKNTKRVLMLKSNSNCTINLPSTLDNHGLIKLFIDNCQECVINVFTPLVTSCIEVAHCKNVVLNIKCPCATIQADLSEGLTINYSLNVFQPLHKIYHSAVRGLEVRRQILKAGSEVTESTGSMDDFILGEKSDTTKPADENQFVTQLDKRDQMQTDLVLRDAGNHPTTGREIAERKRELLDAMKRKGVDPNSAFAQNMLKKEDALNPMDEAASAKEKGNELFKQLDYGQAMLYYSQAILALEGEVATSGETKKTSNDAEVKKKILISCFSNRSACALKLGQHVNALEDANKVLELEPSHVKSLFRKGLSLHALKRYQEACPVLGKALELSPKNKQIKTALQFAERQLMLERRR
jgi:tetratricopeptide (TPR) repeat protein